MFISLLFHRIMIPYFTLIMALSETKVPAVEKTTYPVVKSYLQGGVLDKQATTGAPNEKQNGSWDPEWIVSCYIALTDRMIQLCGGYREDLPDTPVPDTVIFLDKSARPVAWLMDSLWGQLADDDTTQPHYDFLNIDRKTWWALVGRPLVGEENRNPAEFDVNDVPQELIDQIRTHFVIGDVTEENYREKVWQLPTNLDGKEVLIVDEVKSSGATTAMAEALLSRAVPEASFRSDYFWQRPYRETMEIEIQDKQAKTRRVETQQLNVPAWYNKDTPDGREVRDPSRLVMADLVRRMPTQENIKRKIAWLIESVTPEDLGQDLDPVTKRLKQDIAMLSYLNPEDWLDHVLPLTDAMYEWMLQRLGPSSLKRHITRMRTVKNQRGPYRA